MTNSPTNSIPNTTSRVNHFTGLARRRRKFSLLPANGDGSTLTLDFTTGVLDPRLTFTRGSNATFINSSGLVEWANANMYWNTAFEGLSGTNPSLTSSGWGYVFSSGNAVFNGDNTVTMTTTAAQRSVLFRSTGFSGGGLRVVSSVDVTIHSGSLQASQVIVTGTPANAQHYVDGLIWNNTHPNWNGGILPVGTQFNIAYATDTQTSGTTSMWFGVGCTSAIAGSATFVNPRWTMWKGSATVPYYPNTSATNNVPSNNYKSADYQAPRFDHDPTTLAPRGLLIEGTATNYLPFSQGLAGTGWFTGGICTRTQNYATGPDGVANSATRLEMSYSGGEGRTYYASSYTTLPHTNSVWLKSNTGSNQTVRLWNTSGTPVTCTVTPTWQRFQSVNTTGTSLPGYFYLENPSSTVAVDILAWGAQLEAGSGASSYIPTGASTVQRLRDEVVLSSLPGIAFNQSAGTIYSQLEIVEKLRGSFVPYGSFDTSGGGRCWWWLRHNHDTSVGQRILGTAFNSGGSTAITSSNYTHSSGVFKFATSLDPVAGRMVYAIAGGPAQVTNASGFTLATAAQMSLNKNSDVAATDLGSMWVRTIKYWPTALPDATIQALTT